MIGYKRHNKHQRHHTPKKRLARLHHKYRLIIINDETLSEVFSFRLTKMNTFVFVTCASIVLMALVYVLIAYTPLKEYVIPDYPKYEEREKIIANAMKVDSLEHEIGLYDQKLQLLYMVINGDEPPQYMNSANDTIQFTDVTYQRSVEDSLLRAEIQEYNALNVNFQQASYTNPHYSNLYFTPPLRGTITQHFSPADGHFATDVAAPANTVIQSVLSGTVVLSTWSYETGYTIIVQHNSDIVSIYKHASKLLKKSGDAVNAGEAIAIIGNTGEYSTGAHLHFELWYAGKPVNSEEFIAF
ncbi:MAG: M23 family metallopeptidase [Bacteroidales bacterium]|jgi:murein DD-endopeptidase MepM/ murein hydrolase activator NlpD|nr:M23 family metallopeptidase [Bacteroidales bacterium]